MSSRFTTAVLTAATVAAGLATAPAALAASPTPLGSMPSGTVMLKHAHGGGLQVALNAFGLTPGSAHEVALSNAGCTAGAAETGVQVVTVTATGGLQANFKVPARKARGAQSVALLLGTPTASGGGVSPNQMVACANVPQDLQGAQTLPLTPRLGWGSALSGSFAVTYDAHAKTLTVDVNARGFVPGSSHAAHIHQGSCVNQGSVVDMLPDLVADASGDIHTTVTLTGVTSAPPATGLYLNIHLGASSQILSGGTPTLAFQPLLCGDIDTVQQAQTAVPVGSEGERFFSAGQTVTLGTVGHFTFSSTCSKDANGQNQVTFEVTADTIADLDGNGPVAAGTKINIHTDSDALDTTTENPLAAGAFAQVGSASSSTEIAADGQEVDVFYNDGVNWPAVGGAAASDCFAGFTGFATGLPA
jgi:hypothetical protein